MDNLDMLPLTLFLLANKIIVPAPVGRRESFSGSVCRPSWCRPSSGPPAGPPSCLPACQWSCPWDQRRHWFTFSVVQAIAMSGRNVSICHENINKLFASSLVDLLQKTMFKSKTTFKVILWLGKETKIQFVVVKILKSKRNCILKFVVPVPDHTRHYMCCSEKFHPRKK